MLRELWNDDYGVIISAELIMMLTIAVLAVVVGLHSVAKTVNFELGDLAAAFGAADQTWTVDGIINDTHAAVKGSAYGDEADDCDCSEFILVTPVPKRDGSPRNEAENAI